MFMLIKCLFCKCRALQRQGGVGMRTVTASGGLSQKRIGNGTESQCRQGERECHELGCRAAAAAQITGYHTKTLTTGTRHVGRAPVRSVHTSLHTVGRHTSILVSLLSIKRLLVRERHLRHHKAFDINHLAISTPDPAEPACICAVQLRYACL
jgi:hypothetical protein